MRCSFEIAIQQKNLELLGLFLPLFSSFYETNDKYYRPISGRGTCIINKNRSHLS